MFSTLVLPWAMVWTLAAILPLAVNGPLFRRAAQFGLVVLGLGLLTVQAHSPAGWRLLCASLLILYVMKGVVLLASPRESVRGTRWLPYALFFTFWPGMKITGLQSRRPAASDGVQGIGRGVFFLFVGTGIVLVDAIATPRLDPLPAAWICVFGCLTAVHFGLSDILTALIRLSGRPVERLFFNPEQSTSLEDFWSRRWNLPFVDMGRRLFVRPLVRRLGTTGGLFAMFLVSGVLHEMALSYPAGGGWGLPTTYFILQAIGVVVQRRLKIRSRIWTWAIVLLPLPILFHVPFLTSLPLTFVHQLHNVLFARPLSWYLNIVLWLVGVFQLMVLLASRQVPARLHWKEELPRLGNFNRKLMWTYGGFVVFTILGFAVMTFALHDDLLAGARSATVFALFAATYWLLRLAVDMFYFEDNDWPKGAQFVVGHAALNSLFTFLVLGYGGVAVTNFLRSSR